MKQTERYGLNLLEGSDPIRVGPMNENTQKLEEVLAGVEGREEMLAEETWQLGDVRHSARMDLDERWLLCNGDLVDRKQYPELDALLSQTQTASFKAYTTGATNAGDGLRGAADNGDVMLAVGGLAYNKAPLAFAVSHPDQTWLNLHVDETANLYCAAHGDGTWAAGGLSGAVSQYELVVYTTDDLYGVWHKSVLGAAKSTSGYISALAYGGGKWIATACAASSDGTYAYVADDPAGPWRPVAVDPDTQVNLYGAAYREGRWMVCGDSGAVYFADDLDGTWTKAGISGTERLYAVAFGGGQWVAGGSGVVYSAADPYGTWTAKTLDATVTALRWDEELGTWVAAVSSSIRYATDPAGDWVSVGTGSSTVRGLGKAGGVWAAVCDDTLAYTFRVPGDTPVKHLFEMEKTVGGMAGHDGIWVGALGGNLKSGYAPICVGKAHDGPWGLNFAGGGTVDITLTDVAYGSGMWTAVGKIGNYPAVMTAEDPFGAWAVRQISTSVPCTLNAVAVHEGLWVACGTSGYIWCTRDPLGAWTPYQIAGTNALLDIAVWEGLWAVLASSKLWTSSNPEGVATWTAGTPPVTSGMSLLTCGNGLWAIAYTSSSITYLSTSETPESGWTAGVKGLSGAVDGLCEAGGKWWLATSAISTSSSTSTYTVRLAQAENPTEAWTECITQTGIDGVGMAASGQEAVALCKKMVGPSSATMLASARTLPAISADRSYVYIRAKE